MLNLELKPLVVTPALLGAGCAPKKAEAQPTPGTYRLKKMRPHASLSRWRHGFITNDLPHTHRQRSNSKLIKQRSAAETAKLSHCKFEHGSRSVSRRCRQDSRSKRQRTRQLPSPTQTYSSDTAQPSEAWLHPRAKKKKQRAGRRSVYIRVNLRHETCGSTLLPSIGILRTTQTCSPKTFRYHGPLYDPVDAERGRLFGLVSDPIALVAHWPES